MEFFGKIHHRLSANIWSFIYFCIAMVINVILSDDPYWPAAAQATNPRPRSKMIVYVVIDYTSN